MPDDETTNERPEVQLTPTVPAPATAPALNDADLNRAEAPRTEPEQFVAAPEDSDFVELDADDEPRSETARPSALRVAGRLGVRVVTGIVIVAVVGLVVAAASTVPVPAVGGSGIHSGARSQLVTPVPTAQQLVCPGGLLRLASASGKGATKASALGAGSIVSAATTGSAAQHAFSASDAGTAGSGSAPQLLSTPAAATGSATQPIVSGAQSQSVATDEFAGLSSAACSAASGAGWLIGGATSVGRTTLILLANPSDVSATVSLQIFGENGPVTAPGTDGIIVAPRGQRVLSLAGFAPGLVSPVVYVHSRGGQIVASLEQSTVRGLEPGGIDFVGSSATLLRNSVIPGVVISGTAAVQGRLGESGFDDLQTSLRVYLPGTKSVEAKVSVIAEDGKSTGTAIRADLNPGKVTDFPLDNVPDGSYSVRVSTSVPVAASIRVSTAGSAAVAARTDFAWLAPAPLLTADAVVTIANGMTPVIHFDNPTAKAESVTLRAVGGSDLSVSVPAHGVASSPVIAGTTYRLSGYTGLYASVSGVTDGGVTGYVVSPSQQGSSPIRIYG